jgi:hypothetical protein
VALSRKEILGETNMSTPFGLSHNMGDGENAPQSRSWGSTVAIFGVAALVATTGLVTLWDRISAPSVPHNQSYPGSWGKLFQHIDHVLTNKEIVQISLGDTFEIHTFQPERLYTVSVAEIEKAPNTGRFWVTTKISYQDPAQPNKAEPVQLGQDVTEVGPKDRKPGATVPLNGLRLDIPRL